MLYLASTSPRRRALLEAAGIPFALCGPGVEVEGAGSPIEKARARAASKAEGAERPDDEGGLVLGVDTVVEVDGRELGKPRDRDDARRMLESLRGVTHRVHSAHCLRAGDGSVWLEVATSDVSCDELSAAEVEAHLDLDEWRDKAGGYGIQAAAAAFMRVVRGDVDTVIGLSVRTVRELIERAGRA